MECKEALLRALDLCALRDSIAAAKSLCERAAVRLALLQLRLPANRRLRYDRQSSHPRKRRTLTPEPSTLPGRLPRVPRKSYHRSARRDLPANKFSADDVRPERAFLAAIVAPCANPLPPAFFATASSLSRRFCSAGLNQAFLNSGIITEQPKDMTTHVVSLKPKLTSRCFNA